MTRAEAAALLGIVAATIPNVQKSDLPATARAWEIVLFDVSYEDGLAAIIKILREHKIATVPTPGLIKDAIRQIRLACAGENEPPTAYEAWEEAIKYNSWGGNKWSHPLIAEAVRYVGSHDLIYGTYGVAERFMKIYNTLLEREKNKVEVPVIKSIAQKMNMNDVLGITGDNEEVKRIEGKVCNFPKSEKNNPRKEKFG